MIDFLSKYMVYLQASQLKANELEYFEMNKYFFQDQENSHWQEKRSTFYHNHNAVLNYLNNDADAAWQRHICNYIARDNLFNFYSKIDKDWIKSNVDMGSFDSNISSLVRTRPVVYLTTHSFFQVLIPLILAQHTGPVFPFALDETCEDNETIRNYLSQMYDNVSYSLSGGSVLKVGGESHVKSRSKSIKVLKEKGNLYAAIDMLHPSLGVHSKVSLVTSHFKFDVLAGIVSLGIKYNAQFVFPFTSLMPNGKLRFETFLLEGSTTGKVLESFQKVFDSIMLSDISTWEGASSLTYKEGRFS